MPLQTLEGARIQAKATKALVDDLAIHALNGGIVTPGQLRLVSSALAEIAGADLSSICPPVPEQDKVIINRDAIRLLAARDAIPLGVIRKR